MSQTAMFKLRISDVQIESIAPSESLKKRGAKLCLDKFGTSQKPRLLSLACCYLFFRNLRACLCVCHASFCVGYDCLSVPEYLCKVCAEGFIEFAISPWKPRNRSPLPFQEATSYHFLPPQLSTLVICGEHHPALPEVLRQRTPPCEKRVGQRMALPSLLSMLMWLYWRGQCIWYREEAFRYS